MSPSSNSLVGRIAGTGGSPFNGNTASDLFQYLVNHQYLDSTIANSLKQVSVYDFAPQFISIDTGNPSSKSISKVGVGIADTLVDILHANRKNFDELEERLTRLVPKIERISLPSD